jgi:3-oxoacid CoA-transferase B subunit
MAMARRALAELRPGDVVNLGIGIPTLVADLITARARRHLHTENGMLGVGPAPESGGALDFPVNAGKQPVTALPGRGYFDSADSFAMIRGGHVDVAIMGGLQVDEQANLANWAVPGQPLLGIGGAMDLASGARRLIIMMTHAMTTSEGGAHVHRIAGQGAPILEAFQPDAPTLTLSELARRTGMSMGSAQRVTHTLATLGYLDKDPHTRRYRVGPRVLRLARSYMQSVDLQRASQLPMQQARARDRRDRERLGPFRHGHRLRPSHPRSGQHRAPEPVDRLEPPAALHEHGACHGRQPPDDEREAIVRQIAFPFTTNAREVSEDDFWDDLERDPRTGLRGERPRPPTRPSLARSADLQPRGHVVAALGVAVSAQRYDLAALLERLVDPLTRAAASVSHNLGFEPTGEGRRRRSTAST